MEYVSTKQEKFISGFENNILPPLSELTVMTMSLESSEHIAVFDKKYYFDRSEVAFCKRIHEIICVKEEIKQDSDWFKQIHLNLSCPDGLQLIILHLC